MKIELFQVLKYSYDNNSIEHSVMLQTKLEIIGFSFEVVEISKKSKDETKIISAVKEATKKDE